MDTVAINVQQLFFLVTASAHVWQLLFIRTTANHIQLLFSGTGTVTVQQLFSYIGRRAAVHVPRLLWLETVAVNVISCFSLKQHQLPPSSLFLRIAAGHVQTAAVLVLSSARAILAVL